MTPEEISQANGELRDKSAPEVIRWAIAQAEGRAIVSTNFRPYEAVILRSEERRVGKECRSRWSPYH